MHTRDYMMFILSGDGEDILTYHTEEMTNATARNIANKKMTILCAHEVVPLTIKTLDIHVDDIVSNEGDVVNLQTPKVHALVDCDFNVEEAQLDQSRVWF